MGGLLAAPVRAQVDHSAAVWTSVTPTARLSSDVDVALEVHSRYTDDLSRLGQVLVRPGVTWRVRDRLSLATGYVYTRNRPAGRGANDEHRAWQQFTLTLLDVQGGPQLTARTRLEQRWREGAAGTAWRLREQVRAQAPLRSGDGVALFVANEWLVHLNGTEWTRAGVDQVRFAAGLSVPLSDRLRLEPGYLNIVGVRPGTDDMQHIATAHLNWRL